MSILKSIVYLGKQLELDIVAEGVESEQQFEALVAMGCDSIQGFLLCRPLPATEIGPLIVGAAGVSCA
jgi:EAL domain-containing protein (putative c-di-GMP-specific phosphodiesterase class I)